jgi:hypothetical protein
LRTVRQRGGVFVRTFPPRRARPMNCDFG